MIEGFVEQIQADKAIPIDDVRNAFYAIEDKQVFNCLVSLPDGSKRIFKVNTPVLDELDDEQAAFVNSYVRAEIESTLSVIGGKDVTVCFKTPPKSLASFAKQLSELFCARKASSKSKLPKVVTASQNSVDIKYVMETEFIKDRTICGLCISSAGIKAATVAGGNLCCLKEYTFSDQKNIADTIYILIRLMRVQVSLNTDSTAFSAEDRILFQQDLTGAMQKDATCDQIASVVKALEKELKGKLIGIDAVGLNFPDAELRNAVLASAKKPDAVTLYKVSEDIADTELIAQLEDHPQVSVMQFANAIAAIYHANLGLLAK